MTTINNAFITQFEKEVHVAFQQKEAKLLKASRVIPTVTGSTVKFPTVQKVTANSKSRNANLTYLDPAENVVTVTLTDYYAAIPLDWSDEMKTNADFRKVYVESSVGAINRAIDTTIITEYANASNTLTTATGGLTYAKLLEGLTYLNASDVDPEDRFIVIGDKQESEALGISQLTSQDYHTMRGVMNGEVKSALGFTWIRSSLLPKNTTPTPDEQTVYVLSRKAVGVGLNKAVTTRIDWVPQMFGHQITSVVSVGAKIIENNGIAKMVCQI
jgi:hypothetical protein